MITICLFLFFVIVNSQCPSDINVDNILTHLRQFDLIAQVHGNRAAGTSGYQASVGYVISKLQSTNLVVTTQDFTFDNFQVIGTPTFSQTSPSEREFIYSVDFRVMSRSGSGTINAGSVYPVPNLGCNAEDFSAFPSGSIAVISRGTCPYTQKAALARSAGAVAVIIYNNNNGGLFSGSVDTTIPVFSVSNSLGLDFTTATKLSLDVLTLKEVSLTTNVFAETPNSQTSNVIVIGTHLDGVPAGPGINDNGSGSATNLEMALTYDKCLNNPVNKVRFAWWGAEELGLLGSRYYVNDLVENNPAELQRIALNLNFDMIGSPNFFYGIYNGSTAAPELRERCEQITKQFEAAMVGQSKPYELMTYGGGSDYAAFLEAGVAAGGLHSGTRDIKDAESRSKYGGIANAGFDPCYHDYCDSYDNISEEGLTVLAKAAYKVTGYFALNPFSTSTRSPIQKYYYEPDDSTITLY